jgi:pyruvate dehydrogenase E1 component
MFGFQRIGTWPAAGDLRARGFLVGGTAGRTTLNGEGLQHQDGHSHLMAATIPNCVSYDPTFAYELAVIVQHGMDRMYHKQEDVFYYLTVMNENYAHPAMPQGVEEGIIKGMYKFSEGSREKGEGKKRAFNCWAAALSCAKSSLPANCWKGFWHCCRHLSVTSFNELRREGVDCERWNTLHPEAAPRELSASTV